ncbi:MAG: hypothetical protein ACW99A_15560, partial [Candidatus Kariarchaeaceae archaeon]
MNFRLFICCLLICGLSISILNNNTMITPVTSDPIHFVASFHAISESGIYYDVELTDNFIIIAGFDLDYDSISLYHSNGSKYNGTQSPSVHEAVTHNETHIVAARWDGIIEIYDMQLNLKRSFGSQGSGPGQIYVEFGIDMNSTHILVAENGNNRIQIFDHSGNYKTEFGLPADLGLNEFEPWGITTNNNNIFVSDYNNYKIHIFNT